MTSDNDQWRGELKIAERQLIFNLQVTTTNHPFSDQKLPPYLWYISYIISYNIMYLQFLSLVYQWPTCHIKISEAITSRMSFRHATDNDIIYYKLTVIFLLLFSFIAGQKSHREWSPVQCHQHTIETVVAQRENGQNIEGPKELAERNMVSDQGDVQAAAFEKHRAHVSHTVRTHIQVYPRCGDRLLRVSVLMTLEPRPALPLLTSRRHAPR